MAFFTTRELKRVQLAGGPAQLIASIAASWPTGSWNHADEILFSPDTSLQRGIFRVAASGGSPQRLGLTGIASKPQWLPDGRHFLYVAVEGDTGVVRGWTVYAATDEADETEYSNIWLVRLVDTGQAREFREWWVERARET